MSNGTLEDYITGLNAKVDKLVKEASDESQEAEGSSEDAEVLKIAKDNFNLGKDFAKTFCA